MQSQAQQRKLLDAGIRKEPHRVLIIADDVINAKQARDKGIFNRLFTQGRHYKIDLFCISQTVKGFHPMARTNSDMVVSWRSLKYDDRETICCDYLLIEDSGSKKECMKAAHKLMNSISSVQYRAIMICVYQANYASRTQDYVYHYMADPDLKPEMIGDKNQQRERPSIGHVSSYRDKKGKVHEQHLRTRLSKKKKRGIRI